MLKHTLLIIFRNIKQNKSSFFINLVGLSISLASAILILLWVADELNINKGFADETRIYQVMKNSPLEDGISTGAATPDRLAESLAEDLPEIEHAVAVTDPSWFSFVLQVDNKNYKTTTQFVGKDYLNIFSYNMQQGSAGQVLEDPNSMVISEELAKKIFGSTRNVIGKTIQWELLSHHFESEITGILEPLPKNTTAQFEVLLPLEAWFKVCEAIGRGVHWGNNAPNHTIHASFW